MEITVKTHHLFSRRSLLLLLVPLIIEQFLAVAVGMADSIMVANVGESAVSAVSLVDTVMILIINIFAALATGGAVIAGQAIGRRQPKKAQKSGEQLIILVTIISLVLMAIMYLLRGFIVSVVFGSITPEVAGYAMTYMNITFASIPFIAIYNCGAALFRSMGKSSVTMVTSLVMNIINVGGNAILIYGVKMGVEGVAIPTLISRVVASILIIGLLFNKNLVLHLSRPFRFRLNRDLVKNILFIAVPSGVENSMFQLGKILLLSIIALFGTHAITANAIGGIVVNIPIIPVAALGLGMITIVSQCVGAGLYDEVRFYTRKIMKYAYISFITLNILVAVSLPLIVKLYQLSSETTELVYLVILSHCLVSSLFWPSSFTLPNALRSAKDVRFSMVVSVLSMWIIRIGCGILFAVVLEMGMFGVWMGMYADWVVRSIIFVFRYRSRTWLEDSKHLKEEQAEEVPVSVF